MAAITSKQDTDKKARVDKAMDSMKKPGGKLRNVSIRPADNGYTVSVDRDPDADGKAKGKGGDASPMPYCPPNESVFGGKNAKQDVLDHISKHLD